MKIIGYIRVSTDEQGEVGHGLDAQRSAIAKWCQDNGHELVSVKCDIMTSRNIPKLVNRESAIKDAEAGLAQGIVAKDLDRFSRGLLDAATQLDRASRKGWTLYTLDGTDTSDDDTQALTGIKIVFAQEERRRISKRTKAGLAAARAKGVTLGRPRTVTGEVAGKITSMRREGKSYRAIAEILNSENVPAGHGGRWYATTVKNISDRS